MSYENLYLQTHAYILLQGYQKIKQEFKLNHIIDTTARTSVNIEGNPLVDARNRNSSTSIKDLWSIMTVPEITAALFFLKFVRYGK